MGEASTESGPGTARIDRWLFAVRLFKSRSAAAAAVSGGKVHLNGERVKPSRGVRAGDCVTFVRGTVEFDCTVVAVPQKRGPAAKAVQCYDESPASQARRVEFAARMQLASAFAPRRAARPDKHERRTLRRLRGRD